MLSIKDVRPIFVTAAAALSSGGFDSLNTGELGVFTPAGVRVTGTNVAAQDRIILAAKLADGSIQKSDVIDKGEILQASAIEGADDQEFITYVGFNGTTGDIEEINSNAYIISGFIQQLFESETDGRYNKHIRANSGTTADKHAIAQELAKDGIRNFGVKSKEPSPRLKAEVVTDADSAELTGTVTTLTATKGSNVLAIDGTITNSGLVGGFLRLGGTADTDPVYKVTGYSASATVILDTPWQGDSGAVTAEFTSLADFDAAAVGLKLTGLAFPFFLNRVGRIRFRKSIIDFVLNDTFGDTLVTEAQAATKGRNTWEEVAEHEWAMQAFEFGDNQYEVGEPHIFPKRQNVDNSKATYDAITIAFRHRLTGGFRDDMSNKELQIVYPSDAEPTWLSTATNGVRDVLEAFTGVGTTGLETANS
jgi:hypothetical protein